MELNPMNLAELMEFALSNRQISPELAEFVNDTIK
jgi:hypothetical protein